MILGDKGVQLIGRNFLINIALPETKGALVVTNRDPRKQRLKPAVYAGTVEEVGTQCFLVKPGDRVAVKRWDWTQMDVDDERIIASERELVILNDNAPAPGMIVLRLIGEDRKTTLIIPDTARPLLGLSMKGTILGFSPYGIRGEVKGVLEVGKVLHFQRCDDHQWLCGDGRIVIKDGRYFEIMGIEDPEPILSEV